MLTQFYCNSPRNSYDRLSPNSDSEPAAFVDRSKAKTSFRTLLIDPMGLALPGVIRITNIQKKRPGGLENPKNIPYHVCQGDNIAIHSLFQTNLTLNLVIA